MTQKVSLWCIVKYMGSRLWRWMTPEIYYLTALAVASITLYAMSMFVGIDAVAMAAMLFSAIVSGKYTYDEVKYGRMIPPVFLIGCTFNFMIIMIWFALRSGTEISEIVSVLMLVAIFSPILSTIVVVAFVRVRDVYRAAVEYCTPKEVEKT